MTVIALITTILTMLLIALSLAAVVLLAVAALTVGLGGFLPFSNVPPRVRRKAAPYRRWFLVLMAAAFAACVLLALIHMVVPRDTRPFTSDGMREESTSMVSRSRHDTRVKREARAC